MKTYLLRRDGLLASLAELLNRLGVVAQILFASNKNNGKALAEMENLGDPLSIEHVSAIGCLALLIDDGEHQCKRRVTNLFLYVVQRIRRVDSKTDQDNVGVRVR